MAFTSEQMKNWEKYEYVRKSGRWNMFDVRAMEASGLEKRDYLFVMENYGALKAEKEVSNSGRG